MRRNRLALYVHLVWAMWDRIPMIGPAVERRLYRSIEAEAQQMVCTVLGINGMPDHVHLLVKTPATIAIADLVKQVKGVSSHLVNKVLLPGAGFKWQGCYGAFSVSRWDLDRVAAYVKQQKKHHEAGDFFQDWEESYEEVGASNSQVALPSTQVDGPP